MKNIKLIFLILTLSTAAHAQFSFNYKKTSGQKSQWQLKQTFSGGHFEKNSNGNYRLILGADPSQFKIDRTPSGKDLNYQRFQRGSSRNQIYDQNEDFKIYHPIKNKIYR